MEHRQCLFSDSASPQAWMKEEGDANHLCYDTVHISLKSNVGILNKSFTRSCLWRFSVKLRHRYFSCGCTCQLESYSLNEYCIVLYCNIRAVSGSPLVSSGLEEALYKYPE